MNIKELTDKLGILSQTYEKDATREKKLMAQAMYSAMECVLSPTDTDKRIGSLSILLMKTYTNPQITEYVCQLIAADFHLSMKKSDKAMAHLKKAIEEFCSIMGGKVPCIENPTELYEEFRVLNLKNETQRWKGAKKVLLVLYGQEAKDEKAGACIKELLRKVPIYRNDLVEEFSRIILFAILSGLFLGPSLSEGLASWRAALHAGMPVRIQDSFTLINPEMFCIGLVMLVFTIISIHWPYTDSYISIVSKITNKWFWKS